MESNDLERRARFWFMYLRQSTKWKPRASKAVSISEMDDSWRYNAARWLLRRAQLAEMLYTFGELRVLGEPLPVVIGEADGEPIEVLDLEASLFSNRLPSEGSMAADAFDDEIDQRTQDPEVWLKTTPLYQALVQGLDV